MKTNDEINNHISAIKNNWPSEKYFMLREALAYAVKLMENEKSDQKVLSQYTKIVVETDEPNSKTIATVTANDIDSNEGFRVRLTPRYD